MSYILTKSAISVSHGLHILPATYCQLFFFFWRRNMQFVSVQVEKYMCSLSWKNEDEVCRIVSRIYVHLSVQVINGAPAGIRAHRPMPPERRAAFSSTLKCASLAPRVTRSTVRQNGSASPTAPGQAVSPPANVSNSFRRHA